MFQFLKSKPKNVYMDFASKTPLRESVRKNIDLLERELFANPGGIHAPAVRAKQYLDNARKKASDSLGVHPDEIIFTRGGTESDNMAVLGTVFAFRHNPANENITPHIIIGELEHPAIVESVKYLEKNKYATVSIVPVDENGVVDLGKLQESLTPETILVSIQYVNGEIGLIQPIEEVVQIVRRYKKKVHGDRFSAYPLIHTDAAQATGTGIVLNISKLGVDLLALNGGKICGPTSIGLLYKKRGTPIEPIMFGGSQESGFRPGTAPVPLICGFTEALEVATLNNVSDSVYIRAIQEYFISQLTKMIQALSLGDRIAITGVKAIQKRAPHIVHVVFRKIESDQLVLMLDAKGVYVSSQPTCRSGQSHGEAMKKLFNLSETDGTLRFSFGVTTTKKEVEYAIESLSQVLQKICTLERDLGV